MRIYRRGFLSGIVDTLNDIASVISCATKVVENLVDNVKKIDPPFDVVESLTDGLEDLGKQLEKLKKENSPSASVSSPEPTSASSASQSSSSSSSTCTSGSAVPICTETVSLATTFSIDGTNTVTSVKSVTATACTTVTGCNIKPSTAYTTTASASSTATASVCEAGCRACQGPSKRELRALVPLEPRSLWKRKIFNVKEDGKRWNDDNYQRYFMGELQNGPNVKELDWGGLFGAGKEVVAITRELGETAHTTYVAGLVGCTAILIISEKGMWFAHIAEPGFLGGSELFDQRWNDGVIGAFEGEDSDLVLPGSLAGEGGILNKANNPQIFVSTPYAIGTKERQFPDKLNTIMGYLTGSGKEFEGIPIHEFDYDRPKDNDEEENFRTRANGKVLVQYDPKGFRFGPDQPVYRVWQEVPTFEDYTWCLGSASKKRDGSCPLPPASTTMTNTPTKTEEITKSPAETEQPTQTEQSTLTDLPSQNPQSSQTESGTPIISETRTSAPSESPTPTPRPSSPWSSNCPSGCDCSAGVPLCS
ncbi:hypothetical protein CC78DRAFT_612571 [Lojkania enalia]|uniref:Uncharacterized protein n=1 Tax=Lojkania enalia TaxID=147567 RepID=A0A9P4N9I1_9PLEO|nr:hypothetical protein CC78DRAFT_612571 [Didymosphaeria enalia]